MLRGARTSFVRVALCLVCSGAIAVVAGAQPAAGDAAHALQPRVRSSHAYIRAMIEEAAQRSATFRHLLEAIDATDGIVYVEQGECRHSVRACLSLSVTPTAEFRFLRVLVDARQPDWEVMASIGHELRHAIEVLADSSLKTTEAIFLFYVREGVTMGSTFETTAAVKAGDAVKSEVVSFARRR